MLESIHNDRNSNVFSDYSSKANWITIAICNEYFIGTPIYQNHVDNMMPNTWKQASMKENCSYKIKTTGRYECKIGNGVKDYERNTNKMFSTSP